MKRKSKNQAARKRKEFRYHNIDIVNQNGTITRIRHPSYVFLEKGNIYIYISITHSDNVENAIVIKLRNNPNPNDKRDSYRIAESDILPPLKEVGASCSMTLASQA